MNNEGVCRTAQATPGQLINIKLGGVGRLAPPLCPIFLGKKKKNPCDM